MTEKKTERLDIRISHEKKQAFSKACETQSDTPSNAVRRFVNSYIRRANRDETRAGLRTIAPMHWKKVTAITAISLIAVIMLKPFFAKTDTLFSFYDFNKNGVIDLGEITPNDIHLHRVLNIDGEKGISPDEFIAKATMVWRFTNPNIKRVVETKKIGPFDISKTDKSTTFDIDSLPEGVFLFPKDPNADPISIETYKAQGMTPADLGSIDNQELRSIGPVKVLKKDPYFNSHFVIFDLTQQKRPQINVLEKTSIAPYSKSMRFSRSVDWVEGVNTPSFVMGRDADTAILTSTVSESR